MHCLRAVLLASLLLAWAAGPAHADTIAEWNFSGGTADATASGSGSISDSSGNALHGTPNGGPTYRTVSGSNIGLEFDGSNDYVSIADNTKFELTGSLTLEARIKVSGNQTHGLNQLIFRGDSRSSLDPYYLALTSDNKVVFHIENASGGFSKLTSSSAISTSGYVSIAGTLDDATGVQRIYIDGVQVASTTTTIRPFASLSSSWSPGLSLGSLQVGGGQWFDGIMDVARISDEALSGSQLLGTQPVPEPSTLVLFSIGAIALVRSRRRRLAA